MRGGIKIINSGSKRDTYFYKNAVVIAYLYYIDTLDYYVEWLKKLPENMDLVIISASVEVTRRMKDLLDKRNATYVIKENRGRDISALLISAKKYLEKYDFFCYVHDKKANNDWLKDDVREWTYCLWHNTLKDENYINGILDFFNKTPDAGLLQPPNVVCDKLSIGYDDNWYGNLESCNHLLKMLKIKRTLTEKDEVLGVGTAFWARKQCLNKLLEYPWKYELFPQEPLPLDGTISHAVERGLPYIAEEAGFKTYTVMSQEYAEMQLENTNKAMRVMYDFVKKNNYMHNCYEIKKCEQRLRDIKSYIQNKKKVYIYGAGEYGISLMEHLRQNGIEIDGFVVTRIDNNMTKTDLAIYEIDKISLAESTGIIIGVNYDKTAIIKEILVNRGVHDFIDGYFEWESL